MAEFGWAYIRGAASGATPQGVDGSVQFRENSSNFGGSGNLIFDDSTNVLTLSGTLNVSGALNVNELNTNVTNRSVINLSATGSTTFGDSVDDIHQFTGSLQLTSSTNPIKILGLQAGTPPNTSSYVALDSNFNLVLTSAAGGGAASGVIGDAEDGSYTDGLYTDFTTTTPIGTVIDRFNEILKLIVPGGAPAVDRVNFINPGGDELKLSFGSSAAATGYTIVGATGSFGAVDVNGQYTNATSGEDFRLGVYNGTQEITGTINFNTLEQLKGVYTNYTNNAFGNAETGSIKLSVNGSVIHTLNLTASGAGNPNSGSAIDLNSDGSGFIEVSVTASARDQNNVEYGIFQHRTAKFVVDPTSQRKGWNYAKVEHEFGTSNFVTNFVQWVNDTDANSNAMSVSDQALTPTMQGSKYLSGVQYFRSASVEYTAKVANAYKFTYPTGNVLSFNQTNLLGASAQALPSIGGSENNAKVLELTASSNNSTNTMFGTSFVRSLNLTHPFKSNLSSAGSATAAGALIYNLDTANSNTAENFELESHRITSGSYANQAAVTAGAATWNSENHMTGSGAAGHTDGLMFYNSKLVSPKNTDHAGITNGNFSALSNGPANNPNYSGQSGTRTFFRKIQNTSGGTIRDLKITSDKSTKISAASATLSTDNIHFSIKLPGTSGFMDISQNFAYGAIVDGNGALINGANDNSNTGTGTASDSVHCVTFGTASVANNEYVIVKIVADATWTGEINGIVFQLGASDVSAPTEAPLLDDLESNDSGVDVQLSFGAANGIAGFSNATRSSIGGSNIDSNGAFTLSGDRRGTFSSLANKTADLNDDISASGTNFPIDSFKNAYSGSLVLEVNGAEVHELSLTSSILARSTANANGSSIEVSELGFSETTDGIPDYTKNYRTGSIVIDPDDQRLGWNFARILHKTGSISSATNYIDWVVDTNSNALVSSSAELTNFGHSDSYYQSGVGYFANRPTGSFKYAASNVYRNVYSGLSSAVSFPTTTNCSISNIVISGSGVTDKTVSAVQTSLASLNNSSDCEVKDISITGSVLFDDSITSISGGLGIFTDRDVSVNSTVVHPLKSNLTTVTYSKTSFMVYSGSLGSTNLNTEEYFNTETFRIVSGNYVSQSHADLAGNKWNSTYSVNNTASFDNHADGMVTSNGFAISPFQIGNDGDTRNVADGGELQAPDDNPNYSSLDKDIRTFYRYFKNSTGGSSATPTLTLRGDATIVSKSGAFYTGTLGANKFINVEVKVPFDPSFTGLDDTSTAWGDAVKPYSAGTQPDTDGVGVYGGGGSGLDQTVDADGTAFQLQLQQKQIRNNQFVIVKISAHKNWTGYLSRITIAY